MALIFASIIYDILFILLSIIFLTYISFKYSYTYWSRKNVLQLNPTFPFGNASEFFLRQKSFGVIIHDIYNKFRSMNVPFGGYYILGKPNLIITDPELIKCVTTKDFQYFHDKDHYLNEKHDPLTAHLLALKGQQWKNLRTRLTPTFTSGKMKMMYPFFSQCSQQMTHVVDKSVTKSEPIDIKDILARFTTDVIGNCAFGIDCNSLTNPDAEFRKNGIKFTEGLFRLFFIRMLYNANKNLVKLLNLKQFGSDLTNFFLNLVQEIVEHREKNNIQRNDMMNLLIKLRNNESIEDDKEKKIENKNLAKSLTVNEVAAQASVFFFAGFETSSSTMAFGLFELAKNTDVQEKLRQEIAQTLTQHNNELSYEAVMDMNYLDKVIKETLRKYPIASTVNRMCGKDYKIPNTDVIIEKGTSVQISSLGIQRDPVYYPDPLKFDPERFSEENKSTRPPYTYLPFGEGPRSCIGMRFGLLQTKVGIASLIKSYRFTLDPRMKSELDFDRKSVLLSSTDTIWLLGEKL